MAANNSLVFSSELREGEEVETFRDFFAVV